ncbi:zinc finger protein-domain-containing protein [Lasiosphaeria ovina]|uniref:Zinc finger protein-domain-containing protein n=1 Tax=Lasiosphaeria ovina TaxID=92902 RepID=A0AAE0JTK2_9PEZI|nr:zinc finger protein-domain-containing protein [Lasiosphaeria ovina]
MAFRMRADETEDSGISSEMQQFIIDNNRLLDELSSPGEGTSISPAQATTSTASSFAVFNQSQQAAEVSYQKIGFGQCGLVFSKPGSAHVVKIARPYFSDALWEDFLSHLRLFKAFSLHGDTQCRIPRVYSYVNKVNRAWWDANTALLPPNPEFPLPSQALITERILPLPLAIRNVLIDKFCPEGLRESAKASPLNNDCLARMYLGRHRTPNPPLAPNFSLRNYNLCLDQMLALGLPVQDYAREMAACLAIIHWQARVDGYDIEFVLGSDAEYATHVAQSLGMDVEQLEQLPKHSDVEVLLQRRGVRLWVIDFNLCNRFAMDDAFILGHEKEVLSQLVLAFFENDPYYPLPLMETNVDRQLWSIFRQEYLKKAAEILSGASQALKRLPVKFLDACVEREHRKLGKGLGHGHRDFKG